MRTIGRFEICGLLGRGGMGLVYKVRLPVIEKILALKLLHPHPILISLLGEAELKKRFINEAVIMSRMRHPNLLEVWDFEEVAGNPFFVMEYYCNNLGTLIGESGEVEKPSRPLIPERIFHYGRQILDGLHRLHQSGIIHRDLKPFNFLITDEDVIKIGDFGLSLLRGETLPSPDNLKVGSPYYAAPEQEQDPDGVDSRADLYSVGVTLYRLATGRLPSDDRRTPSLIRTDLDSNWDAFLLRGVASEKKDRFASVGEMRHHLELLRLHWEASREGNCRPAPVLPPTPSLKKISPPLRQTPVRVRPAEARNLFQIDELWRPRSFIVPDWQERDDGTVVDRSHDLLWEQSGSEYPQTWPEAGVYVQGLNRDRFAGRAAWRLPTVDELCSLITEAPGVQAYCLAPPFDPGRKCLWSADRRSFNAAWFVSIDLGFVFWQDFTCHYYVRAVSTL
jgi:serine/threonine protein kinase